ncbi:MAG: hypothetical protein LUD72_09565 [Bacteroidales bacterium]|nr:hypothetical protein [Bacteroidales bacterium]
MNSIYGIVRPATIDVSKHVDIFYNYRPTRSTTDEAYSNFTKADDPASMLSCGTVDTNDAIVDNDTRLPGMFNLSLPVSIFGNVGYYTLLIKPREYSFTITDVGALGAYPDVRGIVLNANDAPDEDANFFANDNLIGYRIDYFSTGSTQLERQLYTRIITSNGKCEVMTQNLTSSNMSSTAYRYNDSGSLSFLTVTPSTSPSFKASAIPYIGTPGETITISNTLFDPLCVEVEICEHDVESLWTSLNGDTIRSLDNGLVTVFNPSKGEGTEREIHTQHEYSTVKDSYNKRDVMEVKQLRTDNITFIDSSILDED